MYRKYKKDEFFTRKAHQEGYPARSVYKLQEIDKKYKVIPHGGRILDLGASPGSWLQYAASKVGEKGRVVGVDMQPLSILLPRQASFLQKDLFQVSFSDLVSFTPCFNAVISDAAPSTTGMKLVDVAKSEELAEKAFEIAKEALCTNGNFLCKIFEGEFRKNFLNSISPYFSFAKFIRPSATMKGSRELYVLGLHFNERVKKGIEKHSEE